MTDKTVKVGTIVTFQDTSNEPIATYTWDFGAGEGTSTLKDDTHIYNNIGIYTVTHSVTNACGTTTCAPKMIDVVAELPSGGGSSTAIIMGAALLGFMMMTKK